MKIGSGPVDVTGMSAADVKSTVKLLESKGYEFTVLAGSSDAIIATAIAASTSRDMRLLVTLDRTIDPLRDAEDLAELDQISGGRIAIVFGPLALNEIALAEEMIRGLAGRVVNGVRVFPRPSQLFIPIIAPAEYAVRLGALPMSVDVHEDHFVTMNVEDVPIHRQEMLARAPFALCVHTLDVSSLAELTTAQHLREAIYVEAKAQRLARKMPMSALGPSDLDSPIHRI